MLVVLGLISILGGLGLVAMTSLNREHMERIRDRRNAQEVVALAMGAAASAAPLVAVGDTEETIRLMMEGRTGNSGPFKGRLFRLSTLSDTEIAGAAKYLVWIDDFPVYHYSGDSED